MLIDPLALIVAVIASAVFAALTTPVFAWFGRRIGLVVAPREDRWHRVPTPLLGGAAMALAVLTMLALGDGTSRPMLVVMVGAAAAFGLGLLDDFRHLAPTTKLVGQVIVASILVLGGVTVNILPSPPFEFVLTVFWIVAMMNALNLMDNMDGLAAGITAIAGIVIGITAIRENPEAAMVAGVTAGAALGFLARVFMGDSGSLLLGYLLATSALLHTTSSVTNLGLAVLGPLAALALPIFDTALVTAARRLAGIPISRGGRDHVSHRLAALGLSDRGVVFLLYAVAAILGGLGIVAGILSAYVVPLVVLAAVCLILFGAFLMEVDVYRREPRRSVGAETRFGAAFRLYGRFGAEIALDVVLLTTAYYASYLLRFEGLPDSAYLYLFAESVPIVVGAQLATLVLLRTYRTLWRYLSIADAVGILRAVSIGTTIGAVGVLLVYRFEGYSRAAFIFDWLFACALIVGARSFLLWLRHWFATRPRTGQRRVLVVGAGDAGALALRLLTHATDAAYRPVGFLDDDPGKRYRQVSGVPVVGKVADVETVAGKLRVELVVLALDGRGDSRGVREACDRLGIECREFAVLV